MPCSYHQNHCAYPDWSADRCEFCHASWSKIAAPATRITTKPGVSKSGERIAVEETAYLSGYDEMPLNHFWRHATDAKRAEVGAARRAASRRAA